MCDEGYIWFHHTSMCYKLTVDELSWDEADANCKHQGGNLASVHDSKTSQFLRSLMPSTIVSTSRLRVYIGGSLRDGQWTWTDGSPWNFRDWAVGHPTTRPNDNYLQMMSWYPDGGWSNAPNGFVTLDKYGFICQRKSGEKAEPTIEPEVRPRHLN